MKMNTTVLNIFLAALVCLVVCFWLGVGALGIYFVAGMTLVFVGSDIFHAFRSRRKSRHDTKVAG